MKKLNSDDWKQIADDQMNQIEALRAMLREQGFDDDGIDVELDCLLDTKEGFQPPHVKLLQQAGR